MAKHRVRVKATVMVVEYESDTYGKYPRFSDYCSKGALRVTIVVRVH